MRDVIEPKELAHATDSFVNSGLSESRLHLGGEMGCGPTVGPPRLSLEGGAVTTRGPMLFVVVARSRKCGGENGFSSQADSVVAVVYCQDCFAMYESAVFPRSSFLRAVRVGAGCCGHSSAVNSHCCAPTRTASSNAMISKNLVLAGR